MVKHHLARACQKLCHTGGHDPTLPHPSSPSATVSTSTSTTSPPALTQDADRATLVASPAPLSTANPAQTLPYDLLLDIFSFLARDTDHWADEELIAWPITSSDPTIRGLSLVCRAWQAAGQRTLWHSVCFLHAASPTKFLAAARAHPDLAAETKAMSVGLTGPGIGTDERDDAADEKETKTQLEAVRLAVNLQHLRVLPVLNPTGLTTFGIIDTLPLQTCIVKVFDVFPSLDRDVCTQYYTSVFKLLCHPRLVHLEHNFRPPHVPQHGEALPPPGGTSRLTHLHITVHAPPTLCDALRFLAPSLEVLSLYTEQALDPEDAADAFSTLRELRALRFESNLALGAERAAHPAALQPPHSGPSTPPNNLWFHPILPSYGHLETLSISQDVALPLQFTHIPPSLTLLEYIDFSPAPAPGARLRDFAALVRNPAAVFSACRFVFVADEEAFRASVRVGEVEKVREALGQKGVGFEVRHGIGDLPQRKVVVIC
ncbi:hypothetical protein JCM10207_002688 [Rhodosporidiobolus poonsookiae]